METAAVDKTSVPTPIQALPPDVATGIKPTLPFTAPEGEKISAANAQSLQIGAQLLQELASSFSWLPQSNALALAVDQGIMVYDVKPSTVTAHIESINPTLLSASPAANILAWAGEDQTIQVWHAGENRQILEIQNQAGPLTGLALAQQSQTLAFATFDNQVQVWDALNGQKLGSWELPFWLSNLSFSPDGKILAGADLPRFRVYLLDAATGQEVRRMTWTDHASPALYGVVFSPNWRYLAWTARASVQVSDVSSGEPLYTLEHEDFVTATAWSPDASLLATASAATIDGVLTPVVSLWQAATGNQVRQLPQKGGVLSLSFSPDGTELAVLSSGGALQVWGVAP